MAQLNRTSKLNDHPLRASSDGAGVAGRTRLPSLPSRPDGRKGGAAGPRRSSPIPAAGPEHRSPKATGESAEERRRRAEVRRLRHLVSRIDHSAEVLADLDGRGNGGPPGAGPGTDPTGKLRRIRRRLEAERRRLAERGTDDFRMVLLADGTAELRVNGQSLRLTAKLAELLRLLVEDGGPRTDPLVGWKACDDVAAKLAAWGGSGKPGALRQNISRLRGSLDDAGVNPFLVQTRARHVRFALRRRPPGEPSPVVAVRR